MKNFSLTLLKDLTDMQFDELLSYAASLERALKQQQRELSEHMDARTAKMTPEQKADYVDFESDQFYHLEETFPRILRYSLFVHMYSVFEHTLLKIAEDVKDGKKIALSPRDLKDDGITRAKTYLKKVAGLPFPDTSREWQDIAALASVRNLITHKEGYLEPNHKDKIQIEDFMKRWSPDISLSNVSQFILSEAFIRRAIKVCEKLLHDVFAIC